MSGAFFLSANLAYPAVNLVQVPMVALPELGSRYGFLKAAQALGKATPDALKIIRRHRQDRVQGQRLARSGRGPHYPRAEGRRHLRQKS
jgi:hypothetical protein